MEIIKEDIKVVCSRCFSEISIFGDARYVDLELGNGWFKRYYFCGLCAPALPKAVIELG